MNSVVSQCASFQSPVFPREDDSLFFAVWDYFTERFDEIGEGGMGGAGDGDGVPWKIMKGDLEGWGTHLDVGDIVCFMGSRSGCGSL